MTPHTRHRLLAAAAAALPLIAAALPAPAQTRVNQDGRALDANTRVGSDGSNDRYNGIDRRGQTVTGNQIVTGNVTGGRAFRGRVGYRDPLEFRGDIDRPSDRFVRDSVGAPTRTRPRVGYQSTAFYGDDRATPPPAGYRQEGSTPGFYNTRAGQTTVASGLRNPLYQTTSQVFGSASTLLRPGDVVFDGRRNPDDPQSLLSASPLYGVRPLNDDPLAGTDDSAGPDTPSRRITADRFRINRGQIERMQQELNDAGGADDPEGAQEDGARQPANPDDASRPAGQQSIDRRVGGPGGGAVPDNALEARAGADRLSGSAQTGQSLQRRMLVPPAEQSTTYAQLQQRLAQRQGGRPLGDEEANRQFRLLRRASQDGAGPGGEGADGAEGEDDGQPRDVAGQAGAAKPRAGAAKPQDGAEQPQEGAGRAPTGVRPPSRRPATRAAGANPVPREAQPKAAPNQAEQPDETPAPAEAEPRAAVPAPRPASPPAEVDDAGAPLRVKSLAEGVQAKGLRDLLTSAEELMKAGKFASAIEKYGAAEQVAPNNPLIRLGRAHAELGATYYGRAEQSLRRAIDADPALLMGKYDLQEFVGSDRLGFVVTDLKQIGITEAGSARPMLLLAYIAYSMPGGESAAAHYLDAADGRGKQPDSLIDLMRKSWNLAAAPAPAVETPEFRQAETKTQTGEPAPNK